MPFAGPVNHMPEEIALRLRHPAVIALVSALVTAGITWGAFTTRVADVERRLDADEQFRRDYVTHAEFVQFTAAQDAQFKALRSDLEVLTGARR